MHRHIIIIGEQLLASAQAGGAFPPLPSGATATTIHVVAFAGGGGGGGPRRKHMRLTNGHVGTISGLARERPAWPPVMWSSPWSCRSRRGVGRVHRLTTPELTHSPSLFLCWRPSVCGRRVL